jgi:S-adenosyl-L-methionine hydrolase (adenosine-forming)
MITLLTDFGLADHYVAAMKGVILSICPGVQIVDISHEITAFSIAEGAYTLSQAWKCFPAGTIHVAVVDPGVGSSRLPILAEAGGHFFIGPDNGIFTFVLKEVAKSTVRHITAIQYFRHPVSDTFHGRDIFAPVAAHLESGVSCSTFGAIIQRAVHLESAKPEQLSHNLWRGNVLKIDRFGNIITNFCFESFPFLATRSFQMRIFQDVVSRYCTSYNSDQSDRPFLIKGSSGFYEVSINQGDAASLMRAAPGTPIDLSV